MCKSGAQHLNTGLRLCLARNKLEREIVVSSGVVRMAVGTDELCHLIPPQRLCCRCCLMAELVGFAH